MPLPRSSANGDPPISLPHGRKRLRVASHAMILAVCQIPEKSGLPSARRGAGAGARHGAVEVHRGQQRCTRDAGRGIRLLDARHRGGDIEIGKLRALDQRSQLARAEAAPPVWCRQRSVGLARCRAIFWRHVDDRSGRRVGRQDAAGEARRKHEYKRTLSRAFRPPRSPLRHPV